MTLLDSEYFTGRFHIQLLGPSAISVYFHEGDVRDMSLPIALVASVESLGVARIA